MQQLQGKLFIALQVDRRIRKIIKIEIHADKLAPNGPISEKSTWHHNEDGRTLQEVETRYHERFRHQGGMSQIKK